MNDSSYLESLKIQDHNSKQKNLNFYMQSLYQTLESEFKDCNRLLEVGAGSGMSQKFLPGFNITRTDVMKMVESDIRGEVDLHALPFKNGSFDGIFGVDVLHHMQFPLKGLEEATRILKKGSTAIFIEPYVSIASYPIYKLFHTEKTSWKIRFDPDCALVNTDPNDGDQAIPKSLFCTQRGKEAIADALGDKISIEIRLIDPLSFFATGGLSRPLKTPTSIIRSLLKIESYIPQNAQRFIASRIVLKIKVH